METSHRCRITQMMLAFLILLFMPLQAEENPPPELKRARKDFENEFFRKLESIQEKYGRVLKQYQVGFTRSENLRAAREAQEEAQRAEHWETIPASKEERTLNDPKLNLLLQNYENACRIVIDPITQRYVQTLKILKTSYAQKGDLDASIQVESELVKISKGIGLPAEKGGARHLESLSKKEFSAWLEEQSFDFSGAVSGRITLRFKNGIVEYGPATKYEYKVTKIRTVEIIKKGRAQGFVIDFSKDLQSAEFKSNVGTYPVRINGKQ